MVFIIKSFMLVLLLQYCVCPPVTKKANTDKKSDTNEKTANDLEAMGIEYNRYLNQVVEALESDPEFTKKLENAEEADIRSGKIAQELDFVNHHVRTKLDELKRQELDRLRSLAKLAMEKENNHDSPHLKPPEHLDHANPNSFEIADLHKLITKVIEDLAETDKKRKEDFKEYEMQKEFEQHEKMKTMDEEHKKKYEKELEEMKKKHQKHEPLHHPGSKQQLQEVWEKQDHMEQQEFDPKTFFYLHDLDGNGFWDQEEVKALFLKELDKLYQAGLPEDDMRERAEEMERMREHVFKETDTNRDGVLSLDEFLAETKKPEWNKDEGWETIDQQPVYSPDEYAEFEKRRQEEIQRLIKEGRLPPHPPGYYYGPGGPPPQYQYQHPGQGDQHQYAYGGDQANSVYQHPQQQQQAAYQQQQQVAYQQQQQQQAAYHQQQQAAYQQQQQPSYQQQQQYQQPQQFQQNQQNVPNQISQQQNAPQQGFAQQGQAQQHIPQQQPVASQVPQQQQQQQPIVQQAPPQQPIEHQIPQQPNTPVLQQPHIKSDINKQQHYDPNSIHVDQKQQPINPTNLNNENVQFASGIPKQPLPK